MRPPALRGQLFEAWRWIASPLMVWWLLALWLVPIALYSFGGGLAADALYVHLPWALLPFSLLAASLGKRRLGWLLLWSAGFGAASVGALLAQKDAGVAVLGGAQPTEAFQREVGGLPAQVHLGGRLSATTGEAGTELSLSVGADKGLKAALPMGDAEVELGRWALSLRRVEAGTEPAFARFRLRPRARPEAKPIERALRTGTALTLEDGTQLTLLRLSKDYGGSFGPAAEVQLAKKGSSQTAWVYAGFPDIDARHGTADWVVELASVEAEPRLRMGVRRRSPVAPALIGWGVMVFALLGSTLTKEAA